MKYDTIRNVTSRIESPTRIASAFTIARAVPAIPIEEYERGEQRDDDGDQPDDDDDLHDGQA